MNYDGLKCITTINDTLRLKKTGIQQYFDDDDDDDKNEKKRNKKSQKKGSAADVEFLYAMFYCHCIRTHLNRLAHGESGRLYSRNTFTAHIMLMHFNDAATAAVNNFFFLFKMFQVIDFPCTYYVLTFNFIFKISQKKND